MTDDTQAAANVRRKAQGRFIVLEGIDGSGTTTQVARLGARFRSSGYDVCVTHEPTEGPIGVMIRQVLQGRLVVPTGGGSRSLDWRTMAALFAADRLDHNDAVIRPKLAEGVVVISDRYYLSSLAYQSLTSGDNSEQTLAWVGQLNSRAVRPDLTIVLDVTAEVAAERRQGRGGAPELFEVDSLQQRLAGLYHRAGELVPGDTVVHVDGSQSSDVVELRVWAEVQKLVNPKHSG